MYTNIEDLSRAFPFTKSQIRLRENSIFTTAADFAFSKKVVGVFVLVFRVHKDAKFALVILGDNSVPVFSTFENAERYLKHVEMHANAEYNIADANVVLSKQQVEYWTPIEDDLRNY